MKRFLSEAAKQHASDAAEHAAAAATTASAKRSRTTGSSHQHKQAGASSSSQQPLVANGWTDLGQGARVANFPGKLASMAQQAMQTLMNDIQWQQRDLMLFGKRVAQPRLIAYMADAATPPYTYSGLTLQPTPWSEVVLQVKAAVEQLHPGATYNSCLLNYYKDGLHHVSWHSDNEKLYGHNPTIASVSFGTPRDFVLRHHQNRSRKISVSLCAGDVFLMAGTTQEFWQHSIPKRKGVTQPRINLTFRNIVGL